MDRVVLKEEIEDKISSEMRGPLERRDVHRQPRKKNETMDQRRARKKEKGKRLTITTSCSFANFHQASNPFGGDLPYLSL